VADGMGGVTGGAEASRTGLRGFGSGVLQDVAAKAAAAVDRGFATAWDRILEQARLVPALREMGTTITAIAFDGAQAVLGHIGDSRAYRWRAGSLEQLSTDHTLSGRSSHQLLRCVGGGQQPQAPDLATIELQPGDRLLLCTDGIWNTVPAGRIADVLADKPAQAAAEQLVQLANAAGGPDNSTALVIAYVAAAATDADRTAVLPSEEMPAMAEVTLAAGKQRLGGPRWPWLVLAVAALLLLAVLLRTTVGFDLLVWLQSRL
jgi:protein phosphatase